MSIIKYWPAPVAMVLALLLVPFSAPLEKGLVLW